MNCLLCKYREQIIGYEAAVGAPQEGHHHHVEGIGTDAIARQPPSITITTTATTITTTIMAPHETLRRAAGAR